MRSIILRYAKEFGQLPETAAKSSAIWFLRWVEEEGLRAELAGEGG